MTYAYMTVGKPAPKVREIDRLLGGPDGEQAKRPEEIAAENRKAMAMLGGVGQVKPRKRPGS